jgi:hydroxyacylglutathione hydrolase
LETLGLRETPTVQMNQIYEDLWQTRLETPFAGVQTHAYLLQGTEGNVLLYNTSHADEIQHIAELGGIKYQCLSHRDETGASLQRIKDQFGSKLCCHFKEEPLIARSCLVDITFSERDTHFFDLQVMHTPGHTDGSISFLYRSPHGHTYLFTGDTFFQTNGNWGTFVIPQAGGSTKSLIESLRLYRDLNPDVVVSSASNRGSASLVELSTKEWVNAIDSTIVGLEN